MCLFNHNLSVSFRNKTVYDEILVYCLKICISIARTQSKRKYYQCWVLGTFWKSQKLILSQKNQSVLVAKISSRKTQKSPIRKNKLPQKFGATRYFKNRLNAAFSLARSLQFILKVSATYRLADNWLVCSLRVQCMISKSNVKLCSVRRCITRGIYAKYHY